MNYVKKLRNYCKAHGNKARFTAGYDRVEECGLAIVIFTDADNNARCADGMCPCETDAKIAKREAIQYAAEKALESLGLLPDEGLTPKNDGHLGYYLGVSFF